MRQELQDGLILRSLREGVRSDRENLASFYTTVWHNFDESSTQELIAWANDLISGYHPTTTLDDIWVIVDPARGHQIVSALLLIPQSWCYEGIDFSVGRIELVATLPEYRQRGLVRALMDIAHKRSDELGHLIQCITGIPYYYRQFGYAMAIDLGARSGLNFSAVPELKTGQQPRFTLREATEDDIPELMRWDTYYRKQCLLATVRDDMIWSYELTGRHKISQVYFHVNIIVDSQGESVGYVAFSPSVQRKLYEIVGYVIGQKASYLETFDDVIRGIRDHAQKNDGLDCQRIVFDSGLSPAVDILVGKMTSGVVRETMYAWYLRVPQLATFIEIIKPILEQRLENSMAHRYTGEIKIAFYDMTGLSIRFEQGHIIDAVILGLHQDDAHAAFPYQLFLNMVFGHLSLQSIRQLMPDVWASREATLLLNVLFPQKRSWLMALA